MAKKGLTPKQKRFVDEYIVDQNATQAAIRAGYKEKTAYAIGVENLKKPQIFAEIAARLDKLLKETRVTQERVVHELAAIGFADITDYISVRGETVFIKDTSELTQAQRAAVASIKQGQYGIEIKLNDKLRAVELLAKHLGMLEQRELAAKQESNLFEAMIASAKGELDTDDLSEVEQETAADDDLVEPTTV